MNKERTEALLDAAKICAEVSDAMMEKPSEEVDMSYVVAAAECAHRISMLIAKENGHVKEIQGVTA